MLESIITREASGIKLIKFLSCHISGLAYEPEEEAKFLPEEAADDLVDEDQNCREDIDSKEEFDLHERESCVPLSMLHRWIRTGQIRVNKKRCKPYDILVEGDVVRFPPFVRLAEKKSPPVPVTELQERIGADLAIVAVVNDVLALNKPSGLAVHPGTGLKDSVSGRLSRAYLDSNFIPSPAHRIDRNTSGILLCGMTVSAQKTLHRNFASVDDLHKEYLAWVSGTLSGPLALTDYLAKHIQADGSEKVSVVTGAVNVSGGEQEGKLAEAFARPLLTIEPNDGPGSKSATLVHVRLITGLTHQIRVQLSTRGFPIIGDGKYGGPVHYPMLLHCYRITLPDGTLFSVLPDWPSPFDVFAKDIDSLSEAPTHD